MGLPANAESGGTITMISETKRGLLALVLLCTASSALAADKSDASALLNMAHTSRQEAEVKLARERNQRLEKRKAIAQRIHAGYERLEIARKKTERASARLVSINESTENSAHKIADFEKQLSTLTRQTAQAAGLPPPYIYEALKTEIGAHIDSRLEAIQSACAITYSPETVIDRKGAEQEIPILRIGKFAAYACGMEDDTAGLLLSAPESKPRIIGPFLKTEWVEELRSAAEGNMARIPVDIDGSMQKRQPKAKTSFKEKVATGGPFIYPIIFVGLIGALLAVERFIYLLSTQCPPRLINNLCDEIKRGNAQAAERCAALVRGPGARIARASIDVHSKSEDERETAMESALLAEAPKIERSLSLISALASVAPLLGLLGTVSGMITTFSTIAVAGTGNPKLLSGGISEALITTQLGLMIGIPLLLLHAWLARWVERREAMLEFYAIQLFGLQLHEQHETPSEDAER